MVTASGVTRRHWRLWWGGGTALRLWVFSASTYSFVHVLGGQSVGASSLPAPLRLDPWLPQLVKIQPWYLQLWLLMCTYVYCNIVFTIAVVTVCTYVHLL